MVQIWSISRIAKKKNSCTKLLWRTRKEREDHLWVVAQRDTKNTKLLRMSINIWHFFKIAQSDQNSYCSTTKSKDRCGWTWYHSSKQFPKKTHNSKKWKKGLNNQPTWPRNPCASPSFLPLNPHVLVYFHCHLLPFLFEHTIPRGSLIGRCIGLSLELKVFGGKQRRMGRNLTLKSCRNMDLSADWQLWAVVKSVVCWCLSLVIYQSVLKSNPTCYQVIGPKSDGNKTRIVHNHGCLEN